MSKETGIILQVLLSVVCAVIGLVLYNLGVPAIAELVKGQALASVLPFIALFSVVAIFLLGGLLYGLAANKYGWLGKNPANGMFAGALSIIAVLIVYAVWPKGFGPMIERFVEAAIFLVALVAYNFIQSRSKNTEKKEEAHAH